MSGSNPNPTRISGPTWWFWGQFEKVEPTALLGGIFANKPGYHNYRHALPSYDYSVGQVSTDRADAGGYAAAIDLSMPDAQMRKYSKRLHDACAARDPRLFIGGQAIIREYIGTLDSNQVSCYVLVGGKALGLGVEAAPDWGRDASHLWHVHISVIRKFIDNQDAWKRLLSILKGESAAQYFTTPTGDGKVNSMAIEMGSLIGGDTGFDGRRLDWHFQDMQNLRGYLVGEKHKAAQPPADAPVRALEQIATLKRDLATVQTELSSLKALVTEVRDLLNPVQPAKK